MSTLSKLKSGLVCCLVLLSTIFYSCSKFEFSPYQTEQPGDVPHNLNETNIARLMSNPGDDTVTFLLTGDSQNAYDELEKLVEKANTIEKLDFLILAGDISDYGLIRELVWVTKRLEALRKPYICVIGNHDLAGNGSGSYEDIFGRKNFSFRYKGYKFIFHDTNSREYNFNGLVPDTAWMARQLDDPKAQWFLGVSHVPPYNEDFDPALEIPYRNLLASTNGFILSMHGHQHDGGDFFPYEDRVRYIMSYSVDKRKAVLIKLINGTIIKKIIEY